MSLYLEEVFDCPSCSHLQSHAGSAWPSTQEVIAFSYSYVRALFLVPLRLSSARVRIS
jgi:hypothetical protein